MTFDTFFGTNMTFDTIGSENMTFDASHQYTTGADFLALWFSKNAPSLLCLMMCLAFLLMLGGLLFFHTYLIYTGQTTWEVHISFSTRGSAHAPFF